LAIVSQILSEHRAQIRVEENLPSGTRFVVEIPVFVPADAGNSVGSRAQEAVG
jgi:signal transduction histidine kinase